MNIISWIVFGGIIGAIARFLMPGKQNLGLPLTIGLGIAGSFAGGFIGSLIWSGGGIQPSGWNHVDCRSADRAVRLHAVRREIVSIVVHSANRTP